MRIVLAGALLILAMTFGPSAASACSSASGDTALIHSALPVDPDPRLIVARVDIEFADAQILYKRGLTARVQRVIHGSFDGELMILRSSWSSCSYPFENGTSGLIVGIPLGTEEGALVVDAFEVTRGSGYRLPDGYRIPESYIDQLRGQKR